MVTTARFVIVEPAPLAGRVLNLSRGNTTIGRGAVDQLLPHPGVSRQHAAVHLDRNAVTVEDLGSTGGTRVNGRPSDPSRPLAPGDVVDFGPVVTRFEVDPEPGAGRSVNSATANATAALPVQPAQPAQSATTFTVDRQSDGHFNNVGGDQYNQYLQTVVQQRDGFLRDIASTRTRARRLIQFGFVLFLLGFATFAFTILRFLNVVGGAANDPNALDPTGTSGFEAPWEYHGMPVGLVGWAAGALGIMLIVSGVVMHIVATSRRRRLDTSLPVPPPPGRWAP